VVKVAEKKLLSLAVLAEEPKIPGIWGQGAHFGGGAFLSGGKSVGWKKCGESQESHDLSELPPPNVGTLIEPSIFSWFARLVCTVADKSAKENFVQRFV
jgi:hypothetical protein